MQVVALPARLSQAYHARVYHPRFLGPILPRQISRKYTDRFRNSAFPYCGPAINATSIVEDDNKTNLRYSYMYLYSLKYFFFFFELRNCENLFVLFLLVMSIISLMDERDVWNYFDREISRILKSSSNKIEVVPFG